MPYSKTWKQMRIKFATPPMEKDFDTFFKKEIIDTHIVVKKLKEAKAVFSKKDLNSIENLLQEKINI